MSGSSFTAEYTYVTKKEVCTYRTIPADANGRYLIIKVSEGNSAAIN